MKLLAHLFKGGIHPPDSKAATASKPFAVCSSAISDSTV